MILRQPKGFIANDIKNCPVIIDAQGDSRINITIYNFMKPKERSACYEIAKLEEKGTQKALHICENKERITVAHLSTSSKIKITFSHSEELKEFGNFMMYYEGMFSAIR